MLRFFFCLLRVFSFYFIHLFSLTEILNFDLAELNKLVYLSKLFLIPRSEMHNCVFSSKDLKGYFCFSHLHPVHILLDFFPL